MTFSQNLNPTGSSGHQLKYTKPVGVQSNGAWGGVKLGEPRLWLQSFPYQNATIESVPNLVNAYYNPIVVNNDAIFIEYLYLNWGTDLSNNVDTTSTAFKEQFNVRLDLDDGTFRDISGSDITSISYGGNYPTEPSPVLQIGISTGLVPTFPPPTATVSYIKSTSNTSINLIDMSDEYCHNSNPTNLPITIPPTK